MSGYLFSISSLCETFMRFRLFFALATVASFCMGLLVANVSVFAEEANWSQFRGPSGEGLANAQLPTDLANKANHLWSTKTKGVGWSSPVVSNGQVWFTSAVTKEASAEQIAAKLAGVQFAQIKTLAQSVEFHAICLDVATGQLIHDIVLSTVENPEPINPMNSYASPTPTIVGERVVCHFGNYGTWCLNTQNGQTLWSTKLVVDYSVGPGSSPIVVGDKVLLVCDGIDLQFVAALYLQDGRQAWKTDRPEIRSKNGEFRKAYSTPLILQIHGRPMAIIPGAQWTVAYDPDNGNEIWRADCGDGFSTTPMPIFESGLVVMSTGYTKPEFVAIRPDGTGDVSKTHIAWRANRGAPTMSSAVARDGDMIAISDAGIITRYDALTGKEKARNRIGGNFSASPILSGQNLYFSDRKGVVTVVKADSELSVVSKNDFGSPILASPAVIGNDLILRTEESVIRITSK